MGQAGLQRARRAVQRGGIIAYPTEGVIGLGCNPFDAAALRRLVEIKGRDARKGFIVIVDRIEALAPFVIFPDKVVHERVQSRWPGPVTWVLPARPGLNPLLTGGGRTLAVRVTAYPPTAALCQLVGPLVSTSANHSGRPAIRDRLRCRAVLGRWLDAVAPGECGNLSGPTEIRDALTDQVLRPPSAPRSGR
jgi:L-threonylcarbamoyladenylate synthase